MNLGVGRATKITQIVKSEDECSLSEYDLLKLAVILQRISNRKDKKQ